MTSTDPRLLRTVAIYGANASGKSNLIEAMQVMRNFVLESSVGGQVEKVIPVEPFRLRDDKIRAPSHFEWVFIVDSEKFRYGFVLDSKRIRSEWLFRKRHGTKEVALFTRESQEITPNPDQFKEGLERRKFARQNALFLSVCAQLNGEISTRILVWFGRSTFIPNLSSRAYFNFTAERLKDPEQAKELSLFAQRADLTICGLTSEGREITDAQLPSGLSDPQRRRFAVSLARRKIKTQHFRYDKSGAKSGITETFDLEDDESEGTRRFVALSGPLFDMIARGGLLVIDEFEAQLHPLLTQELFEFFHSASQTTNCQFIIATHDVLLMDPERMRRDQVYFCEKDEGEGTSLYSLAEFDPEDVRPTTKFSRQYLLGIFGAVPRLTIGQTETQEIAQKETRDGEA